MFTPEAISKDLGASLLHTFDQALSMVPWLPMKPLEKLELCSEHDKQIIQGFTKNIATVNESLLHEMALEHARLTPDAPAVQSWDGNYTYRELDIITSKVASYLAKRGVGPETFVLSCFEKSKWPIVARLAVLKAGGAYISIDATDPPNFLKSVVDRVNAKIMLVSPGYEKKFASVIENVIPITDAIDESASLTTPICSSVKPNNACLILFTSGSTGQPKGIIQEHRTFATAIRDYVKALGMGRHSRVLQFDDYAFDISNNDYLASLTAGGCCCVPTPVKEISALVESINTLKANTTFLTPTFAIWLDPHLVPTLELVCIGGEPLSNELLEQWRGHVKLVNQYGMGEAATFCALNQNPKPGENAIVGYPGSGAIWLTDPSSPDILVPVGAVGEIIIEGPHLSRGYLDDVSLKADVGFLKTAPAWIKDLHPSRTSSRFYRSGDLGRYRHDGSIEHMGRKDTIIKINGCRVESTEVEYVLRKQVPTDHQVLVDLLGAIDGIKDPQIVAFLYLADNPMNLVRSAPDETMTFTAISERHVFRKTVQEMETNTGSILPKHMVPTLFILIDKIPRTRSNKTDRRKLRFLAQKWYSSQYLQ